MRLAGASVVRTIENTGEVYVAATGDDTSGDGSETKPYKTISKALTGKTEAAAIVMKDGTHDAETAAVTLGYAHTIKGSAANAVTKSVKAITDGVFKATVATGTVKFEKMTFQLVSYKIQTGKTAAEGDQATPLSSNVFVLSAGGTLALDAVTFKMADLTAAQQAYAQVDAITAEVIKATAGTVTLTSVSFTGITMGKDSTPAAVPLINTGDDSALTLAGSSFEDITLDETTLITTKTDMSKLTINTATVGSSTVSTSFKNIMRKASADGVPAVLDLALGASGTTDISKATFTNCGTKDDHIAGAVKITLSAAGGTLTITKDQFTAIDNTFTKKTCAVIFAAASTDLLFNAPTDTTAGYDLDTKLSDMATANNKYYGIVGATGSEVTAQLKLFNTDPTAPIYVGKDGAAKSAIAKCGHEELPCATVADALTQLGTGTDIKVKYANDYDSADLFGGTGLAIAKAVTIEGVADTTTEAYPTIVVDPSTQTATPMQVKGADAAAAITITIKQLVFSYDLSSADMTKSLITLVKGSATSRDNANGDVTLVLDTVTITSDPGSGKVKTESIIAVTSGELKLKTVTIISIELDAVPVFKLDTGATFTMTPAGSNPEVDPCLFADITSGANAAIFDLTNPTITIQNAIFMACSGTKAGVAYVTGLAGDTVTWTKPLLFTGCDATTKTAEYAANVYVELASGMSQAAAGAFNTGSKFSVLKDLSSTQGGDFKFSKVGATSGNGDNLEMFTWAAEDNTYYVSGTGVDTAAGTRAAPLLTISKALTTASTTASTIKLLGGMHGAETAAVTLSIAHTITGLGETADDVVKLVTAQNGGSFQATLTSGTASVKLITFSLAASMAKSVFVMSGNGGTLALEKVAFVMADTGDLTAEVISATAGTVAMTSATFTELAMGTGKSLIGTAAATLTLATCTFSDITLADSPLLAVGTAKDKFAITATTTFSKITRTSGNGAVVEATVDKDDALAIAKAEFTECKCTKGYGGAAYIELKKDASLSVTGVKFTKCESHYSTGQALARANAAADAGMGGGLCIYLTGTPKEGGFVLSDITFSSCKAGDNDNGYGNALAIGASDAKYIAEDASIWNSVKKITSDKDEDMVVAVVEVDTTTGAVTVNKDTVVKLSERADISGGDGEGDKKKGDNDDDGFPTWAIIVIIVGAVLIIAVVVIVIILVLRKKKTSSSDEEEGKSMEQVEVSSDE